MHTRHSKILSATYALLLSAILCGCGLYTPEKDVFSKDTSDGAGYTTGGGYESSIVDHVTCEIAQGLRESEKLQLPWLTGAGETQPGWGVTVTQTITVEDQGGVAPGITLINPLQNAVFHFVSGGNVVSAQSFLFNVGATASANSLRTETIQYTFRNKDILNLPRKACTQTSSGVLIDGDLKIREFIHDKATIAALGNSSLGIGGPGATAFNNFTEEITFVAAYGGTATPTWKLARLSANTSSNLLIAQRTITNDLIITLGPLLCQKGEQDTAPVCASDKVNPKRWVCTPNPCAGYSKDKPVELTQSAMNQHNARVSASAIAASVLGQTH